MKVAIVHDYLVNRGGAERVVEAMARLWPDAPIYTSIYHPEATYDFFRDRDVRTSRLQRLSNDPAKFRRLLPMFPRAFESMDLREYDVVVSSSSGFAHGVRVAPGTCHIVYSYTPPRFLWGDGYDLAGIAPRWARPAIPPVRAWLRRKDRAAAQRPHFYLGVSKVAARRIKEVYGRNSTVLHPPVDIDRFTVSRQLSDYYLLVGRLLPYRRADLAVRAFTQMGRKLVVVGDGPARAELESLAGPTIEFRGVVTDEELVSLYARARGVVVPGEEDFGLTPVEANASGRPAIAYAAGGALETVVDGLTGVLFPRQTPESLARAVQRAETMSFDPMIMRSTARRFGQEAFAARLAEFVDHATSTCIECRRRARLGVRPVRSRKPVPLEALAEEA